MLGPKIAAYQLLCLTLNVIVVALSPGSYRAVNHGMGTQLQWDLTDLGPSVPASSASVSTQIYKGGLFFM